MKTKTKDKFTGSLPFTLWTWIHEGRIELSEDSRLEFTSSFNGDFEKAARFVGALEVEKAFKEIRYGDRTPSFGGYGTPFFIGGHKTPFSPHGRGGPEPYTPSWRLRHDKERFFVHGPFGRRGSGGSGKAILSSSLSSRSKVAAFIKRVRKDWEAAAAIDAEIKETRAKKKLELKARAEDDRRNLSLALPGGPKSPRLDEEMLLSALAFGKINIRVDLKPGLEGAKKLARLDKLLVEWAAIEDLK